MPKLPLLALLFSAFATQADLLTALQAYDQKDFTKASSEFNALLPLGSEQAAFNLAAMAYNGEGQPQDLVRAASYFALAAVLGHPKANELYQQVVAKLDTTQQTQVQQQLATLQAQVKVPAKLIEQPVAKDNAEWREPVKRREPEFPKEAAQKGAFGYVTMRFLVNEAGNVEAIDTLDSYPKGLFDRAAIKAMKGWQYQPGKGKFIGKVVLEFSLGPLQPQSLHRYMNEHKLWEYAALGSPTHQAALGSVLTLANISASSATIVDPALPPSLGPLPDWYFDRAKRLNVSLELPEGFKGSADVQLDAQGKVIKVKAWPEHKQTEFEGRLLQQQLTKREVPAGEYRLYANGSKRHELVQLHRIPETFTDTYWWEQAARGGQLEAQRIMASRDPRWEQYLLQQQDPVVLAWNGARLIIDGQQKAGELLLDQAIAKGYETAKELKAAL